MITQEVSINDIIKKYPFLFKKYSGKKFVSYGWHSLLEGLCVAVKFYIDEEQKDFKSFSFTSFQRIQGMLYVNSTNEDKVIEQMIKFSERLSYSTCEACGNTGKLFRSELTSKFVQYETLCERDALKKLYFEI